MKVKAKYQIGYKGKIYTHGQEFELEEKDFEEYKNDVIEVKKKNHRKPTKKVTKSKKTK